MSTVVEALAQAKAHHAAGDLRRAQQFYRRVLQADRGNAEAHFLLGVTCHALGELDEALASLEHAARLDPQHAEAHNYRGAALVQQGKLDEAIASFERACRLRPDSGHLTGNLRNALAAKDKSLGDACAGRGQLDEAAAAYRRALERKPDFAEAHNNLGTVLAEQDKLGAAVDCFRRAVEIRPDDPESCLNLGVVLERQAALHEAMACYRRVVELKPDYAPGHNCLGALLARWDRPDEAVACYRRALELKPDYAEAHTNLGAAVERQGKFDEAAQCHRLALQLKPDFAEALCNLGGTLERMGRLQEAAAACRRALGLKPELAKAHHNLGLALSGAGKPDEAMASFQRALDTQPFALSFSNTLLILQYQPEVTAGQLAAAHRQFDERYAAGFRSAWRPHDNQPDPERRLRVGFVSADLGLHPVGYFLVRALENLDRRQAETVCYSDRPRDDAMTVRLRAAATHWRDTHALNDQQLADQIRADGIDILFDLAGHTAGNRLLTFARKPAPIQITWIGYVGTTGLAAMDYLLADRFQAPETAEPHITERVLRMPDGYVCYDPPADAPSVSPLPALERGYVTFGSFNNLAKITPRVIETWASILGRVAGSRLVLKYRGLDSPSVARRMVDAFGQHGVDAARLELRGWSPQGDLLRQYQNIDVALDTFPYSGGLTTCEALWMGVSVVTCPGETFASRHSLSHLSNVGLTETIAGNLDEYVELAVALAGDLPRLAATRAGLRQQMAASPLCDGNRFSENLTRTLRDAWRQWCADQTANLR